MAEAGENYSVVVSHLTKKYGELKALDDVSFSIKKGEILGFLGPNGAGKSTTMRIISGLMPATSGCAYICGESVANYPDLAQKHIGFMLENNPLPEDMRVIEYLRYRAKIKGLSRREYKARVDEVMEICQLKRKAAKRIIGNLSKGFRQRVGIADAILAKPEVIIMDEPTIGLDPHQILAIRRLINSLRGEMSVIISSHILPEIELMCDRVIIINQGEIVANGSPDELRLEFITESVYKISAKASSEQMQNLLGIIDSSLVLDSATKPDDEGFSEFTVKTPILEDMGEKIVCELSKDTALRLREVYRKKPTLEDIFMAATKRSWESVVDIKNKDS